MILLIDNYDSFSYNLYQLIGALDPDVQVIRNDELTVTEIRALSPDCIIISPGPGRPEDAGICVDLIRDLDGSIPVLGVCLGHQAICQAYGADITYARQLMHGKQSEVRLDSGCMLFKGVPGTTLVGRYHSLAVDPATMPDTLAAVATTGDGEVMAVMHREHPVFGMQFHPESILTPHGGVMLQNFLEHARKQRGQA